MKLASKNLGGSSLDLYKGRLITLVQMYMSHTEKLREQRQEEAMKLAEAGASARSGNDTGAAKNALKRDQLYRDDRMVQKNTGTKNEATKTK